MMTPTHNPEAFIRKLSGYIHKIILHYFPGMPPEMREDIHQEVQLKLWKSQKKGKEIRNLKSYTWRVVYTTALDIMDTCHEKASIRIDDPGNREAVAYPEDHSPSLDRMFEKRVFNRELERCIAALTPNKRIAVKLYLSGMNIREIAEFMNWNHSKANHLYYRALADLKKAFRIHGYR